MKEINASFLSSISSRSEKDVLSSTSFFTALEFGNEADPSTADGGRVVYDREVPFEVRSSDAHDGSREVGSLEAVKAKMLVIGEESQPLSVRVELTSENDLFFHYQHTLDQTGFRSIQERQKLMVDFPEYPQLLMRMLNNCIKEPHSHLAVFLIYPDGRARLDFIQNMEYKFVELLALDFYQSPDDAVRSSLTYRYNTMKSRLALMQARLQDVNALVKIKNPSLLLQLQRTPPRAPGRKSFT